MSELTERVVDGAVLTADGIRKEKINILNFNEGKNSTLTLGVWGSMLSISVSTEEILWAIAGHGNVEEQEEAQDGD